MLVKGKSSVELRLKKCGCGRESDEARLESSAHGVLEVAALRKLNLKAFF